MNLRGIRVVRRRVTPELDDEDYANPFRPERPVGSLRRLVLPDQVRADLDAALAIFVHGKTLFDRWGLGATERRRRRMVLSLHGPPGTGKTLAAGAIANALRRRMIRVSYAELLSKWVGDTEQNIAAAFRAAAERNAVLFVDEAEALLGRRVDDGTSMSRFFVSEASVVLTELEAFDGVVVFASNMPGAYDAAYRRRITAHVEFPLPDLACRSRLWRMMLPRRLPVADDVRLATLALESDGLSGADIRDVILAAARTAVLRHGARRRVDLRDLRDQVERVRLARERAGEL